MISYGGIPFRDAPPALTAWLMAMLSPQEAFGFYRPRRLSDLAFNPRSGFNWFLSRPIKLNTFFNPWGASRWGTFYGLIDQAGLDSIRTKVYASGGFAALPLVMDDGLGGAMQTSLFMLPAVPLTGAPLSAQDVAVKLYLLVLVDERFFWWERAAAISINEGTTSWGNLFAALAVGVGSTFVQDAIATAYLKPSVGLARTSEYLPLLLDWAAESVGQRIVRTLDGTFHARSASAAKTLADGQKNLYVALAGGQLDLATDAPANVPASVSVRFPRADNGTLGATFDQLTIKLANLALPAYSGAGGRPGTHLVHDTAVANFLAVTYIAILPNNQIPPPDNPADWVVQVETTAPYAGGTTYTLGNSVTNGGSTYLYTNVTPSAGHAPPNATYWTLLPTGINAIGVWDTGSYAVGDAVSAAANSMQLFSLARQIATDFYLWRLAALDVSYRSVVPWITDGMHDIEWGSVLTRVHRSEWEPEFGALKHAGAYGSSDVQTSAITSIIAYTAANFTIPAVGFNVAVAITSAVPTSIWMVAAPQTIVITDAYPAYASGTTYSIGGTASLANVNYTCILGTTGNAPPNATYWSVAGNVHTVFGSVTAIADSTDFTFQTGRVAVGTAGNTMASGASIIISGDPAAGGCCDNCGCDCSPNQLGIEIFTRIGSSDGPFFTTNLFKNGNCRWYVSSTASDVNGTFSYTVSLSISAGQMTFAYECIQGANHWAATGVLSSFTCNPFRYGYGPIVATYATVYENVPVYNNGVLVGNTGTLLTFASSCSGIDGDDGSSTGLTLTVEGTKSEPTLTLGGILNTTSGGTGVNASTFPSGATPVSDGTPGDPFVPWIPSGTGPPSAGQGAAGSIYIDKTDPSNLLIYFKS